VALYEMKKVQPIFDTYSTGSQLFLIHELVKLQ